MSVSAESESTGEVLHSDEDRDRSAAETKGDTISQEADSQPESIDEDEPAGED